MVRAALDRLPQADVVPHYPLDDRSMAMMEQGARQGALRALPFPAWDAVDREAYEAAFLRCLMAARHDPHAIIAAFRDHLERRATHELDHPLRPDVSPSIWSAVSWAWERAEEEAEGHYGATLPPRWRELYTLTVRFRLIIEQLRVGARRAGQPRAEFRAALARLTSLEMRGRRPGRGWPPVLLSVFVEELSGLPAVQQQPILTQAEAEILLGAPLLLLRLVERSEGAVRPLVESWRRFVPHYGLLVPTDMDAATPDAPFPPSDLDRDGIPAALLEGIERREERQIARPAPIRLAELVAAQLCGISMAGVRAAKTQSATPSLARCRVARRAWRGDSPVS